MISAYKIFKILQSARKKVTFGDVDYYLKDFIEKDTWRSHPEIRLVFEAVPLVDDFIIKVDSVGEYIEDRYKKYVDMIFKNLMFYERGKTFGMIDIEIRYGDLVFPWDGDCCCELYQSPEFRNKVDRLAQKVDTLRDNDKELTVSIESMDISMMYCEIYYVIRGIFRKSKNVDFLDEFLPDYAWHDQHKIDFHEMFEYIENKDMGYIYLDDIKIRE